MPTSLTPEELARDLAVRDLTDPADRPHAIQLLVDLATEALATRWGGEVRGCRGARVVSLADNYDHLRYPSEAVTRDAGYTRYVDDQHVLRSHTSALIPEALRRLAADPVDDVLLVCPGIVYRRDAIDRLHTGTPHQLDLWRTSRRSLGTGDLHDMITTLAEVLVPGHPWRAEGRSHPYTLEGRQVDIDTDSGWVEVWECGLAHPDVLAAAGLAGWHGLALGMGLDRLLMVRKNIPDIRLLRSTDPRVDGQMTDLTPYRPVSTLPPIRRDLSVAVDRHDTDEDIGDRVRAALGDDAGLIEEVTVVSEARYADLPDTAIQRLGMAPGHKNVLVRLVIRPLDRTLTNQEANHLRDRVEAAIHLGTNGTWASAAPGGKTP
jgi:phenylalanyl-tRNA synthetase alpha chain